MLTVTYVSKQFLETTYLHISDIESTDCNLEEIAELVRLDLKLDSTYWIRIYEPNQIFGLNSDAPIVPLSELKEFFDKRNQIRERFKQIKGKGK